MLSHIAAIACLVASALAAPVPADEAERLRLLGRDRLTFRLRMEPDARGNWPRPPHRGWKSGFGRNSAASPGKSDSLFV